MSVPGTAARPRLDYVSPLPPVRSGISDYSADLLPHVEPLCDLRVMALPGQEVAPEIVRRWRPQPAALCGDEGRLPLYQMGNNSHHEGVLALAMERPGVVTLHDMVLHHLLVEATIAHGRDEHMAEYRDRLARDHGWVGAEAGAARYWTELGEAAMFSLTGHRTLLRRQRGVLVHNQWAADRIAEESGELAIRVVPMGVPLPPRPDPAARRAFRQRLGVGARTPLLGSFGFQTPIKRTLVAIRALAREELAAAHLVVAGEVSPILDLDREAAAAGVADRVHVTGFLDAAEFQAAIAACDLCLNLRYPTAGETSASLLRVLAQGRPAVVSDYAQFRELPDDVAVKVPLGKAEEEALAAAVGGLLVAPARLEAMSVAARDHVRERHDPSRAAAAIVSHCEAFAGIAPPGDAAVSMPPPSSLVWRRLAGELEVEGAEPPWPVGERRRLRLSLRNTGFGSWLRTREKKLGGVWVEIHWRSHLRQPDIGTQWLRLQRDLGPGEGVELEVEVRRPLGVEFLIIEPHLLGVAGFNALGGPNWVSEIPA
jgi:glycosyltransferase involved in cell wall biosynthesis